MLGKVKQTITDWQKLTHDEVQRINNGQNIEVEINLHYGKDCKSGPEVIRLYCIHSYAYVRSLRPMRNQPSLMFVNEIFIVNSGIRILYLLFVFSKGRG